MKIVLELKDEYLSNLKYVILGLFVIIGIAYVYFFEGGNSNIYLLLATIFAIYMAINLGANDVANNMGPAVGSKALTLTGALIIAVIFEAAGALISGGDVVDTIKDGIINSEMINKNSIEFIAIMLSALLGSSLWVNIATFLKAPVSITHAIFGGLIGAGIISSGFAIVNWDMVGKVAGAWIIAILMGAFIAILLFISIRKTILKQDDKGEAAKHWVPIYVSLMVGVFSLYLILKGFKNNLKGLEKTLELNNISFTNTAIFFSVVLAVVVYIFLIIYFKKQKHSFFKDKTKFVNKLFNLPLIFAVALLSFAHGANDVANAIGPLAAIYEAVQEGGANVLNGNTKVGIPFWIMLIGAISISIGLAVFGGRLIKTVGNEITKLDQIRAYCVALSAAITVIIASAAGMPVSTTQIALGGVFGIGLYREYLKRQKGSDKETIEKSKINSILLSWVVTIPISGIIAAIVYKIIIFLS